MTASERKKSPDFFEDHELDPVAAVAGSRSAGTALVPKKKAGFYLSENLLDRFNRCFHQLKLEGVAPLWKGFSHLLWMIWKKEK